MNFTRNFGFLLLLYIVQYVAGRSYVLPAHWSIGPASAINPVQGATHPDSLKILSRVKRVRRAANFDEAPLVDGPYDMSTRAKVRFPVWDDADGEYREAYNNNNNS